MCEFMQLPEHAQKLCSQNGENVKRPVQLPELVFELVFEGIQKSPRHKSGIAVRFLRMNRWRLDKPAEEADTIETVRSLLNQANAIS